MLKPKNIIIFVAIGAVLVLIYIFFIKPAPEEAGLVSTSTDKSGITGSPNTSGEDSLGAKNFLSILLNVKNIKLDDSIFSDIAFSTLRDSSIILTPDGTEGRPNPFAPIGIDKATLPTNVPTTSSAASSNQQLPSTSTSTPSLGAPSVVN